MFWTFLDPSTNCSECRRLLKTVSDALTAHTAALAAMTEAAQHDPAESLDRTADRVRETWEARELAVDRYEEHQVSHQPRVMAARMPRD